MFTKRHEEQLAEIKALNYALRQRFDDILKELERIKKAHEELVTSKEHTTARPTPRVVGDSVSKTEADGAKRVAAVKRSREVEAWAPRRRSAAAVPRPRTLRSRGARGKTASAPARSASSSLRPLRALATSRTPRGG